MSSKNIPELISFKLCPYVQRSAITLKEKNIEFKTTYVDLQNLPDWFADVSPLGNVPVLQVEGKSVFESAVIAEYLDERYEPKLHPDSLLKKAQHRSWTEFASAITMNMFKMLHAQTEDDFNELLSALRKQFAVVEKELTSQGAFFDGERFSLIDAAYAPIFLRLHLLGSIYQLDVFDQSSRIGTWSAALLERDSVKNSVVDDFDAIFLMAVKSNGNYLSQQVSGAE